MNHRSSLFLMACLLVVGLIGCSEPTATTRDKTEQKQVPLDFELRPPTVSGGGAGSELDKKSDDKKSDDKKSDDKKSDDKKSDDKKSDDKNSDDKKSDDTKSDDKKTDNKKSDDTKSDDKKAEDKKG